MMSNLLVLRKEAQVSLLESFAGDVHRLVIDNPWDPPEVTEVVTTCALTGRSCKVEESDTQGRIVKRARSLIVSVGGLSDCEHMRAHARSANF